MMDRDPFRQPSRPTITIALMILAAANVIVATLLDAYSQPPGSPVWTWLGAPTAEQLRAGAVWGYLSSIFPHGNLLHLAFNLAWLWPFGKWLETGDNRWHVVAVVVLSAWCGTGLQVLIGGQTGIGLSGVVYGLFGYAWIRGWYQPEEQLKRNIVVLFAAWFLVAIIITRLGWLPIGNAAHAGGFVAGAAWAPVQYGRLWQRALGFVLLTLLLIASLVPLALSAG